MTDRKRLANAIRALAMDAVQKANSGHPGAPMGMADIAEVLWRDYLRHNPANPAWPDRDRFVLSNGHGSMLLYALLHLTGYDLPIEELKRFRQLHSKTPGHPEYGMTPGVETTTGPLGQGLTNAVGMAIAERMLAAQFNRPGHEIVDHFTYVFLGDGCLMEGISHEACSLAGTLGLGKLICFYDDNGISIDGEVEGWFTDDTPKRFEAYGWQVIPNVNGHDPEEIRAAIETARGDLSRPTLICCRTVIGYGSPNKAGTHDSHGAPLGEDEVQLTREELGWEYPPFEIPEDVYAAWDARGKGKALEADWQARFDAYRKEHPELAAEFERRVIRGELPGDWEEALDAWIARLNEEKPKLATRAASGKTIAQIVDRIPELVGGSADLTPSNNTRWPGAVAFSKAHPEGRYLHYGVREFGMSAIMNGMALHGGVIPYGGTFLIFSDYARNAIRMSALMHQRVIYVFTHDSIGLGEDGPTHQPIEQTSSLRLIPGLHVWRPADAVETAVAWGEALRRKDGPSVLALTRQGVPHLERTPEQVAAIRRGGYVLADADGEPELILIATGSEVALALAAREELARAGRRVRVVSMPCCEVFDAQDAAWREAVLPASVRRRVAVEAGATPWWHRYVGLDGRVIGLDRFGESAPGPELFRHFGFTVENVVRVAGELLQA